MDFLNKTLEELEFNRVLDQISYYSLTKIGKENCRLIRPSNDKKKILNQVTKLVKESSVITKDNKSLKLKVQTICLHGDNKNVINIISYLIKELKQLSINVKSY